MNYQYQEYPKWKYSKTKGNVIVNNPDEEKKLGTGYQDRPFPEDPKPAEKK